MSFSITRDGFVSSVVSLLLFGLLYLKGPNVSKLLAHMPSIIHILFHFEELTTLWDSTHGNNVQLGFSFNVTFRICLFVFVIL